MVKNTMFSLRNCLTKNSASPEELVTLNSGDTGMLKDGVGTWGSRSALVGGAAIVAAARKLKKQVENKCRKILTGKLAEGQLFI